MEGLNILITGSTTGLGLHTAKELFRKGATVLLTCRDEVRGRHAVEEVIACCSPTADRSKESGRIHLYSLDVTNYNSIVEFCEEIRRDFDQLHVIINNAGIMGYPFELSVDGIEMHFATNVFGHYVIVSRLLPLLRNSTRHDFQSRVVVVSSGLYRNCWSMPQVTKLMGEKHWDYNSRQAYAFSKLSNCLYTVALSKLLNPYKIGVYCVRPGFVSGTELGRETHWMLRAIASPLIWLVAKSIDQGIDTIVFVSETRGEELRTGRMYYERKVEKYNAMVTTETIRQLWAILRYMEDQLWKRNSRLTEEQKIEGIRTRELFDESLIIYDQDCNE